MSHQGATSGPGASLTFTCDVAATGAELRRGAVVSGRPAVGTFATGEGPDGRQVQCHRRCPRG